MLIGVSLIVKVALVLPVVALIICTNMQAEKVREENAFLLQDPLERQAAQALLSGQALEGYNLLNERLIVQKVVECMQTPFNTVALGSSRILQLTAEAAHGGSFFNFGMSGADYRDIMNMFYLLKKADKLPQNLIIGLDPWLLNPSEDALHNFSSAEIFSEFLELELDYDTHYEPPPPPEEPPQGLWNIAGRYFNLARFQENFFNPPQVSSDENLAPIATGDLFQNSTELKLPDGTALYPVAFRNAGEEKVAQSAELEATTFLRMEEYYAPSEELCNLFEQFCMYVKNQGVNLIFVLMPYHPIVYQYVAENRREFTGFFLTEPWFRQFAKQNNIPLYGSYDPFALKMGFNDFYDGLHISRQSVPRVFPGVQMALNAVENGTQNSWWPQNVNEISVDMAMKFLEYRYSIEAPDVLRRLDDMDISGGNCYVFGRYASDEEGATRLARYAVDKNIYEMYRYDDIVGDWVVDRRR